MEAKIDKASVKNKGWIIQQLITFFKIKKYKINAGKGCVIKFNNEFYLTDNAILTLGNNLVIQDYAFFQLTKLYKNWCICSNS